MSGVRKKKMNDGRVVEREMRVERAENWVSLREIVELN